MKTIAGVAITVVVVFLLLWSLTSSNTSPQTTASSTEEGKVMGKSAPVHQANHLNKLTVDRAGCSCVLGCDDPRVRWDSCQADVHSVTNGQRIDWSLGCNQKWATCVELTPNEDYYFEIVRGLPECPQHPTIMGQQINSISLTCVKIHARPYDAIYVNAKREKR